MSKIGQWRYRIEASIVRRLFSFDITRFQVALQNIGVSQGDSLMVHCSLSPLNGFQGKPVQIINALKEAVGRSGLLIMPSMTYTDSSKAYLLRNEAMRVKRSPSRMGLISEIFRRGKDVHRSWSPTHPLLAWGDRAEWFVAGHNTSELSFGPASPFAKLYDCGGKVLVVNCSLQNATYMHFVEDRFKGCLPFSLYDPEPIVGTVVTNNDERLTVPTRVLSDESRQCRREDRFWRKAKNLGLIRSKRIWRSTLNAFECRPVTSLAEMMSKSGHLYFEVPVTVSRERT